MTFLGRVRVWRWLAVGAATLLTGCAGFFSDPSTTTTTSTTTNSGNYAYVVNQTTDSLGAFNLAGGTLTSVVTSAAYTLPSALAPTSVVVSRANTFVYVAGLDAIECFAIGTGGTLTQVTTGGATEVAAFRAMATSPDGQWLFAVDSLNDDIWVFNINASTGALSLTSQLSFALTGVLPGSAVSTSAVPNSIKVSPAGNYVAVSLGPSGDELYAFNTSTGVLTFTGGVVAPAGFTDNAVQFDSASAYLFVARGPTTGSGTSSINSFSIGNNGQLTSLQTVASGNAPYSLEMNAAGTFLYAANRGDSTISGYAFSSGALTALSTSPFPSGASVTSLARDNSKQYLVAASLSGSSDLTLYSFDALAAGKLDAVSVAASGTDPAGSIAVATTH